MAKWIRYYVRKTGKWNAPDCTYYYNFCGTPVTALTIFEEGDTPTEEQQRRSEELSYKTAIRALKNQIELYGRDVRNWP